MIIPKTIKLPRKKKKAIKKAWKKEMSKFMSKLELPIFLIDRINPEYLKYSESLYSSLIKKIKLHHDKN